MGEVSSLLVIWSVTAFVLEVPSGALADAVSRRALLCVGSLLCASGFAVWIAFPSYPAFATGMALWGTGAALTSGTFEALLYDELAAHGNALSYATVMGWANASATVANLAGTVAAAPLFVIGGYQLVAWISVGIALLQALMALSLPRTAPPTGTDHAGTPGHAPEGLGRRYLGMLTAGVREATRAPVVRHLVFIVSLLAGLFVFDEYFPFVAREHGAATSTVPLLLGLTVAGQALGAALAGRCARVRGTAMGTVVALAAILIAAGALQGRWAGFLAIAVGYGMLTNAYVVAEAQMQATISGPARATVTSAAGLLSEAFSLLVFAVFALGVTWLTVSSLVVALTVPMLAVAALVRLWLPRPTPSDSPRAQPGAAVARAR